MGLRNYAKKAQLQYHRKKQYQENQYCFCLRLKPVRKSIAALSPYSAILTSTKLIKQPKEKEKKLLRGILF
jgi:hypothetical protein